ncbi:hypothetical protein BJY04DRAFT_202103 [Aspergillus karnatakaensis]|uniref:uncharacterized protein n=1 Tax=Aspergillus karnatakaensis TaxID=1810916 RepID=UPI003CCD4012
METQFYNRGLVNKEDVMWYWVDDKAELDGKGRNEVQQLYERLAHDPIPQDLSTLWVCLMVDRAAITSMLRVYGRPSTEIYTSVRSRSLRREVDYLPYLTVVDSNEMEEDGPEEDDGEYHGSFKCAVKCVFDLYGNEQSLAPEEYYPRNGRIWGGEVGMNYEVPGDP